MRDKLIQHAIRQSYGERLQSEQLPEYVIFIDLPANDVDVNVHPSKHEVRFHHARLLHDLLVKTIDEALSSFYKHDTSQEQQSGLSFEAREQSRSYQSALTEKSQPIKQYASSPSSFAGLKPKKTMEQVQINPERRIDHEKMHSAIEQEKSHPLPHKIDSDFRVLFVQQGRFVYTEYKQSIWLFDVQTLFTEETKVIVKETETLKMTPLLVPVRIRVNNEEKEWCQQHQALLENNGFEVKLHFPFLIIKQVPNVLRQFSGQTIPQLFERIMKQKQSVDSLQSLILNQKVDLYSLQQAQTKLNELSLDDDFVNRFTLAAKKLDSQTILGMS